MRLVTVVAPLLLVASACIQYDPPAAPVTTKFSFDHQAVSELSIVKSDPATGDRWSARIQREDPAGESWSVTPAGEAHAIRDRRADSRFVVHLLDTLRTLRSVATAPRGALDSFGLNPPRFALRWTLPGNAQYELRVGAETKSQAGDLGAWCQLATPGEDAASAPVTLASGATLKMLEYLASFQTLRLRTLATFASDDVDELELRRGRRSVFYAQREGSDWSDRKRKPIRADVTAWLEGVTHGRIREFIDDPEDPAAKDSARIERDALYEAKLTDRQGRTTTIRVLLGSKNRLLATISTRPSAIFELYPELIRSFEPPHVR